MIFVDADVLLIDLRYRNDAKFAVNRQTLDLLRSGEYQAAITVQALLEVVGVLSFNLAAASVVRLPDLIPIQYSLAVVPDPNFHPGYANCSIADLVTRMGRRMALGDAVQATQVEVFGAGATALLSWNAKHFAGKITVPVQTPAEWLAQSAAP